MLLIILIVIIFIVGNIIAILHLRKTEYVRLHEMNGRLEAILFEQKSITDSVNDLEGKIGRQFLFYDIVRKIDPILDKQELLSTFVDQMRRSGAVDDVCLANFTKDGYVAFTIRGDEGEVLLIKPKTRDVLEYMPMLADILALCLERISLYERLQKLSIYDALTSVFNRRYFIQRYNDEFERAVKHKSNLSLLIIDLDYFKKVNDQYGHLIGDVVLTQIAKVIKDSIREIDFASRFGGEEFAVVLSDTDQDGALMVAERIRMRIGACKIRAFDEVISVTASIGVSTYPLNGNSSDGVIGVADKMLYKAKESGRNCVVSA